MTLGLASSASDSDVLKRGIPWWLSEGYSTKFIRGDFGPRSNPLSFSYTISEKKRTPSVYLLLTNGTRYIPTLEIPIPLNEEKGGGTGINSSIYGIIRGLSLSNFINTFVTFCKLQAISKSKAKHNEYR